MAPPSADVDATSAPHQAFPSKLGAVPGTTEIQNLAVSKPLVYSGSLDEYRFFDVTPVIGREYPEAKLIDILKDDAKIRDLAIQGTCEQAQLEQKAIQMQLILTIRLNSVPTRRCLFS